jgi:hypothetical protein
MRFGRDETAFLKPEDNGAWDWEGEGDQEMMGEEMMEDQMVVFDPVDDLKKSNKTNGKN